MFQNKPLLRMLRHCGPVAKARCFPNRAVVAVLALSVLGGLLIATSLADDSKSISAKRRKEIEQLIDQLATTNPEPEDVKGENYHIEYPASWSASKQHIVYRAIDKLTGMGIEAFPQLIEHFEDKRYSFSDEALNGSGNEKYKCDVGNVCLKIMRSIVDHHIRSERLSDPTARDFESLSSATAARDWCAKNAHRQLWELQADAQRWAIKADSAVKSPDPTTAKRLSEIAKKNRVVLDQLVNNKQPIPTEPIRPITAK